jgi:hypothetical protein
MMKSTIMKNILLFLGLTMMILLPAGAQEQLIGLTSNPVIHYEISKTPAAQEAIRELEYPKPIKLPFFDDFHTDNIFPDTALFTDKHAFINDDFPFRSANIGAATLDAIDETGNIYPDASMFPFIADYLTSRPIRLDTIYLPNETRPITRADSVYFSFFYQPQGRGNPPEFGDSLILEFGYLGDDSVFLRMDSITVDASSYLLDPNDTIFPLDTLYVPLGCEEGLYIINFDTIVWGDLITLPCDSVFEPRIEWQRVWSSEGMSLDTFYAIYNTYSRQVIIPIDDSARYYKKYFFFRFYNYASLASNVNPSWRSNCDQWNIDYIYLDIGRSAGDTFYRDITFAERAPSFLTQYTAMPLRQYRNDPTNQLKDSLQLYITNLSADTFNVYYEYIIDARGDPYTHTYNGGFANLYPFFNTGYQSCDNVPQHACPPRDFLFPLSSQADSTSYTIRHVIHDQSNPDLADTIHFVQKFYNYYAYDDGTPELGYGLSLAGAKAACKYELNIADSLKGIAMFFNRVQNDQNDQFFHLQVWDNNNGKPGNLLWSKEGLKPKFSEELYRMQIYEVDPPLPVLGTIFIGWEQTTGDLLNVGFDTHNDASENVFFNATGNWEQSLKEGALLMRPIFYDYYDPFSISEPLREISWRIYPNPVSGGSIMIESTDPERVNNTNTEIMLFDLTGRSVLTQPYATKINVANVAPGIYFLRILNDEKSIFHTHKLIIN